MWEQENGLWEHPRSMWEQESGLREHLFIVGNGSIARALLRQGGKQFQEKRCGEEGMLHEVLFVFEEDLRAAGSCCNSIRRHLNKLAASSIRGDTGAETVWQSTNKWSFYP